MARGGYRPGSGRPRKHPAVAKANGCGNRADQAGDTSLKGTDRPFSGTAAAGKRGKVTPLQYMLNVVNDELADVGRRDRLAVAAAPYVHPRAGDVGKRERQKRDALTAHLGTEWED